MSLEALHRAVVANPEDHTVRLVYADALDEAGGKSDAARAEFIRSQIELATRPEGDPTAADIAARCRKLFEEHWLGWWRPVCLASSLPPPHTPSRRLRDRIVQALGEAHPAGWPYFRSGTDPTTINLSGTGMSIRFAAGFPEEVRFLSTEGSVGGPGLPHHWGDAMPLVRLAFSSAITPIEWQQIEGPHLDRLSSLTFDRVLPDTTMLVALSPHLAALKHLSINPYEANPDAIRLIVQSPVWRGLRSLHFTGRLPPAAVHELAAQCRLEQLEALDLILGNPVDLGGGAVGQLLTDVVRVVARVFAFPTAATQWHEYGPALEALAASPWVRNLRRLSITLGGAQRLLGMLGDRLYGTAERGADLIPDSAFHALVGGLNLDTLERLVLPAAVMGPSVREELTTRLGSRVAFG